VIPNRRDLSLECLIFSPIYGVYQPTGALLMNPFNDPINIVLLIAVLFVFWRLKGALGERTGFEKPPVDLAQYRREKAKNAEAQRAEGDKAVDPQDIRMPAEEDRPSVWAGYAKDDSDVALGILNIAERSPGFTAKTFVEGAKMAYEMVLNAFAKGDKAALKPLLSREVYDGFAGAIDARAKAGHTRKMEFVGVKNVEVVAARLDGNRAEVTLRLIGEMVAATIDKQGETIEGNQNALREVHDTWTFERDVTSKNPNWFVVDTTDDAETVA
jgi:predicted lipid-binding transport protein (Tim44 family)